MPYLAVKDLKKSKQLWEMLARERELVITRDGKPCAIMVEVGPDEAETSLAEIRRALFSAAISSARRKAEKSPPTPDGIDREIRLSRKTSAS